MPTIRLRELRKRKRVPQRELGEIMGVGQSTVSAWERGKRSPEVEQLQRLSEFFEVPVDYLLGFDSRYSAPDSAPPVDEPDLPGDDEVDDADLEDRQDVEEELSAIESSDISPEGILQLCRFYEYVKVRYPARRHH